MPETFQKHLDESIKLELNLATLYTVLHDSFSDDEDFWWELAMEERGHASLLQQEKKQPCQKEFFPDNLLAKDLQSLLDTNRRISELIDEFSAKPPSRSKAFHTALDIEQAAGEAHFQEFLDSPSSSYSANIFKQLNQEDRDHAERIREYMKQNGIS
ncbi:MAG: rubrerythrin family protein [Chlorobiaceae bacterium]|nr:rubrerythrin family protein [Chlorobiaceae bacterium]NTV16887.1 rubrerythrin family protein [Chlorobiaceae bacterium]